jgi:hypothetical protein
MIAYDSFHQGLVRDLRGYRKGADRLFVKEMIGRRLQRKLHQTAWDLFFLMCPTHAQVEPLLTKSLDYEQIFLLNFFFAKNQENKGGQQQSAVLTTNFWKDVKNRKFCSVNTSAVLEQPEWRQFIYNLWDPRRRKKPADWETSNYTITKFNFTNELKK